MKFRDNQTQQPAELELAPMIDIVFLLLIFFIVSWQFARFERDEDIKVPDAVQTDKNDRKSGEIIVNIREDGEIIVNGGPISEAALLQKLVKLAKDYPNQAVILRGDKKTSFRYMITVLDQIKEAGIWNVAFATNKKTKKWQPPTFCYSFVYHLSSP